MNVANTYLYLNIAFLNLHSCQVYYSRPLFLRVSGVPLTAFFIGLLTSLRRCVNKKKKETQAPYALFVSELQTSAMVRDAEKQAKQTPKSSLKRMDSLGDALLTSLLDNAHANAGRPAKTTPLLQRPPKSRKGRSKVL